MRVERVRAIVVAEPSCQSAICDDWLDLRSPAPDTDVRAIAAKTTSIESFLESRWGSHPRTPVWDDTPEASGEDVLYHGHCHAKALWGNDAHTGALQRAAGGRIRVLDSGCCGMAGAFGYQHPDTSRLVAADRLVPALDGMDLAVAAGTSCRHQVRDLTGVRAVHPAELIAEALA